MKVYKPIAVLMGAVYLLQVSCVKNYSVKVSEVSTDFSEKSIVQVFMATINASRNSLYVDARQVNGASATLSTGSIFPPSGHGFTLDGGVRAFLLRDTLVSSTQIPLSFASNMQTAKHHTIFFYDTITSPKQRTIVDNIVVPTDTSCRIRFANFIYCPYNIPAVDVYSYYKAANIFTNVPVTEVTDFISYPSRLTADTLYVRETGTSNLLLKVSIGTLTPKRNYTFVYRGSHRGTKASTLFATY